MNERIEELVRNAGLTIEHDVVFGSHSYEGKLGMHGDEIEKFAELIVKECMARCRADENSPSYEAAARIADLLELKNEQQ